MTFCPNCKRYDIRSNATKVWCVACGWELTFLLENEKPKTVDPEVAALVQHLSDMYDQINYQIQVIQKGLLRTHPEFDPFEMQYKDGKYMLAELLVAKANILVARTNLMKEN